jgi:hypothetical protein
MATKQFGKRGPDAGATRAAPSLSLPSHISYEQLLGDLGAKDDAPRGAAEGPRYVPVSFLGVLAAAFAALIVEPLMLMAVGTLHESFFSSLFGYASQSREHAVDAGATFLPFILMLVWQAGHNAAIYSMASVFASRIIGRSEMAIFIGIGGLCGIFYCASLAMRGAAIPPHAWAVEMAIATSSALVYRLVAGSKPRVADA